MKPVNYDLVAPEYDRRYDASQFEGIEACLARFLGDDVGTVLEVGCGTGHWLATAALRHRNLVLGLDRSAGMLQQAQATAPTARLIQGEAASLPFATASLDRVFCVNALHHFDAPLAFIRETRRVLRAGGGFLTIGLDPHRALDEWWVYDYFQSALFHDRQRYPATADIRDWLSGEGFRDITTGIAEHIDVTVPYEHALAQGVVDRSATSQLLVISDAEYAAGRARLSEDRPVLRADLRLYASFGWI